MSNLPCRICGNDIANKRHFAREMMLGMRDVFEYLECGSCGCLQIVDIPKNIASYYPANYYSYNNEGEQYVIDASFRNRIKKRIKKALVRHYKLDGDAIGKAFSKFAKDPFPWLKKGLVNYQSKILDVGCGTGELLLSMRYNGFENLHGADPFIDRDIDYQCGVKVLKSEIYDLQPGYDLVMMHHSFEHMEQQLKVLQKLHDLLNRSCYAIIAIPVMGSYAWRKYGVNWVQLDAPRHFYLHTTQSMQILADKAGFQLKEVIFNSSHFQFTGSEMYLRNVQLSGGAVKFSSEQWQAFVSEAARLNSINDGDCAIYYLQKVS